MREDDFRSYSLNWNTGSSDCDPGRSRGCMCVCMLSIKQSCPHDCQQSYEGASSGLYAFLVEQRAFTVSLPFEDTRRRASTKFAPLRSVPTTLKGFVLLLFFFFPSFESLQREKTGKCTWSVYTSEARRCYFREQYPLEWLFPLTPPQLSFCLRWTWKNTIK